MAIPEIQLQSNNVTLRLLWVNNIYKKRGLDNKINHWVNCSFDKDEFDFINKKNKKAFVQISVLASYWPELMPGTLWRNGECIGREGTRYSLSFEIPKHKYSSSELTDLLKKENDKFELKGSKSFFYLPKNEITIHLNNQPITSYKGVIIPRSASSAFYFINSDNMFYEAVSSVGGAINAFDENKSFELSEIEGRNSIYLNPKTPLHDATFWCRILHDTHFNLTYFKMVNDYYFQENRVTNKDEFRNIHLEADIPFEGNHSIRAYCRPYRDFLILDTITYHQDEWRDFEDIGVYKEQKFQLAKKVDKSKLEKTGHNHLKPYKIGRNPHTNNLIGHDPSMISNKKHIRFSGREEEPPTYKRIEKTDQKGYSSLSIDYQDEINSITTNPNLETGSGTPKQDIIHTDVGLEKSLEKKEEKNKYIGLNAIEKLIKVKSEIENEPEVKSCKFITLFKDPFKDHSDEVNVFPPMHNYSKIIQLRNDNDYKWHSKNFVYKKDKVENRKPQYGYGVKLRGIVILEVQFKDNYFYIIEIEPSGKIARMFNTFLVNDPQFLQILVHDNDHLKGTFRTLLSLFVQTKGVYKEDAFSQSKVFEVRIRPGGFKEDLTTKQFSEEIINWIKEVK